MTKLISCFNIINGPFFFKKKIGKYNNVSFPSCIRDIDNEKRQFKRKKKNQ